MALYIGLYIFIGLVAILSANAPKKVQLYLGWIVLIVIALFQGLRWRTGTDWQPYLDAFVNPDSATDYCEAGYLFVNRFVGFFTCSYTVFLLLQCFFGLYSTYRFSRFCGVDNVSMALLYTFASTIFPIRMTTAVAVFMFAYPYIVKKELIKYLIVCAIAISIHSAAIVALPAYFIVNRHYSGKILLGLYLVSCVVGLLSSMVFDGILGVAGQLYYSTSELAQRKMDSYIVENQEESALSIINYLNALIFIVLFLYIRKKYYKESKVYDVLLNMYVFGIAFNRVVSGAIPYLARTTAFYSAGFVVMLLLWNAKLHPSKRYLLVFLLVLYAMTFYLGQVDKFSDVFVPYYSVFSPISRPVVY